MRLAAFFGFMLVCFTPVVFSAAEIVDKTWYMTSMGSMPISLDDFPDRKPELSLRQDGKFSAWAGCNQMMGQYTLDKNEIKFSNAAMTMMMCDGKMQFEQDFAKMLSNAAYWSVEGIGNTLNLKSAELEIIAVFDDTPTFP